MSRHAKRKSSKPKRPKTKLGLPDLDRSKSAVLDTLRSSESKRGYRHAIDEFIQLYCSERRTDREKLQHGIECVFDTVAVGVIRPHLADRLGNGTSARQLRCLARQPSCRITPYS